MSKEEKPKVRRTKEGGVLSPGRPRKIKEEKPAKAEKTVKIGRPKGAVNAVNVVTKNNIRNFLNMKFDDMCRAFDDIEDPYAKFKAYIEMMNYVFPKMRSVEFSGEEGKSTLEAKMLVMINKSVDNEVKDVEHTEL